MKTLCKRFLPSAMATVLVLVLAPAAAAQEPEGEVVPPENSAVDQYTEPFPTAGGNKDAHEQEGRDASPGRVLGTRNAHRLQREGGAGRAVAELAAETAPAPPAPTVDVDDEDSASGGGAGESGPGAGKGAAAGRSGAAPAPPEGSSPTVELPPASGSSGFGAVLAHAFGASPSAGTGFLLPLLILATGVWAGAYLSRQRQTAA